MKGPDASVYSSINPRSAIGGRRRGRGLNNPTWLFAVGIIACFWAARTCDAQIESNAYISSNASNNVSVIDTRTNTVVGSPIPVGAAPFGVAASPDGRFVYVANVVSNTVSVINAVTNQVSSTIQVGTAPF